VTDTPGGRLFLVRAACGGGERKPESLKAFAERVRLATGANYDPSTLSLLERDIQKWRLEDAANFAAVDPAGRGPGWLAFGDELPESPSEELDGAEWRRKRG
jgi:hypothetical protein